MGTRRFCDWCKVEIDQLKVIRLFGGTHPQIVSVQYEAEICQDCVDYFLEIVGRTPFTSEMRANITSASVSS